MKRIAILCGAILLPVAMAEAAQGPEDLAGAFPYVVQVLIDDQFSCTGVVLLPQVVITAGHCLAAEGKLDSSQLAGKASIRIIGAEGGAPRSIAAERLLLAPEYAQRHEVFSEKLFDVGLLLFAQPLPLAPAPSVIEHLDFASIGADYTGPGRLSAANARAYIEAAAQVAIDGTATGVGVGQSDCANVLVDASCKALDGKRRSVQLSLRDPLDCFRRTNVDPTDLANAASSALFRLSFWCTSGTNPGERFLRGDSGAPLLMKTGAGAKIVVGIQASFAGTSKEKLDLNISPSLLPALELLGAAARLGYIGK